MRIARVAALIVWGLLAPLICVSSASAEKRVALIVGMSAYKFVAPLDNPGNDARLMAETLRALGFALIGDGPQLDLDKASLDVAVQNFSEQMQGADVALFYYSGHGLQVRGENFLVPVAANPVREADIDFQLMDVNVVLRQMEHAGTKLNVVILDACRNNPFGSRRFRAVTRGLARMVAPEGTIISYATQPGNVALDGNDGNSPYTKALAQMMRRPGLDIFQTFNEVGLAVMHTTGNSQQPWLSSSPIKGRFYFSGDPISSQSSALPNVVGSNDAERAWNAIKDTSSVAIIEAFLSQYGDSFYAIFARARLDELKKSQVAVIAPPIPPIPPTSAQPPQTDDREKCEKLLGESAIAACTRAIASGRYQGIVLSVLYYNRGSYYSEESEYDRAIADYTEAIRLDPNHADAFNNRGRAYFEKKAYERAIADYTEAIRIDPKNATAFNYRGNSYAEKMSYDRAIADYTAVIRLEPDDADAYQFRGEAKLRKGDRIGGNADIAKAKELGYKAK